MATRSKKYTSFVERIFVRPYRWAVARTRTFMGWRPHRSFRRTPRRDALRPLALPGVFAFTKEVSLIFWQHKKALLGLAGLYIAVFFLVVGAGSQSSYQQLSESLQGTGYDLLEGNLGAVNQALILVLSIMNGNLNSALDASQQIVIGATALFMWLSVVWYLRTARAGHKVKIRDALYSSGGPIIAMTVIVAVIIVQLIPVGFAALGYTAASSTGLIAGGGVEAMLFWLAAGLLALLSAFWITSSLFAMIIVTLPGMYPFRALSIAGGMVLGRRVKILLRWLWAVVCVFVGWALVLIPVILLDGVLKDNLGVVEWLPVVPVVVLLLTGVTMIWSATYVYTLYRKVVDVDASK